MVLASIRAPVRALKLQQGTYHGTLAGVWYKGRTNSVQNVPWSDVTPVKQHNV